MLVFQNWLILIELNQFCKIMVVEYVCVGAIIINLICFLIVCVVPWNQDQWVQPNCRVKSSLMIKLDRAELSHKLRPHLAPRWVLILRSFLAPRVLLVETKIMLVIKGIGVRIGVDASWPCYVAMNGWRGNGWLLWTPWWKWGKNRNSRARTIEEPGQQEKKRPADAMETFPLSDEKGFNPFPPAT